MAKLINCKGCGVEISKKANACPHCGEPKAKETSFLTWLVLILFIFGIFGAFSPDSGIKSTTSTSKPTQNTYVKKEPTQAEIKQKQEAKNKDILYFKQSKEVILEDINQKIQNKKYGDVLMITAKYLSYKGKDDDIIKINTETRVLAANEIKIKETKNKKEREDKHKKEILKKLKTIPSSEYARNQQLYKTLLSYEPNNKKYKTKVKFYTDKINKEKKKRTDRLANFGKVPTQSAWDGSYYVVENYLERVAKDPDSVKIASCTQVMHSKDGWLVGCTWRGRNGFGGMAVATNWFTIRHDNVIRMDKASAYTF